MSSVSISNIVKAVNHCFRLNLSRYDKSRIGSIPTSSFAISCLAIFYFKWPSLLSYEKQKQLNNVRENIKKLFKLDDFPSDTQMRERLDVVDSLEFRKPFKEIFAMLQRNKILEKYVFLNDSYLVSIDGTGSYSRSSYNANQLVFQTKQ